ncbi:hypothetical protein JCM16303_006627 [Sporobolomyces ruberrimus]
MDLLNLVSVNTSLRTFPSSSMVTSLPLESFTSSLPSRRIPSNTHLTNLNQLKSTRALEGISTTTIFAIIYVPLPTTDLTPPPSSSITVTTSSKNSTLEEYASGTEYTNYTFFQLATIAFSTLLTILIVLTGFACILVQSERMKKVMRDAQEEEGEDSSSDRSERDEEREVFLLGNPSSEEGKSMRSRYEMEGTGKEKGTGERAGLLEGRGRRSSASSSSESDVPLDRRLDRRGAAGRPR